MKIKLKETANKIIDELFLHGGEVYVVGGLVRDYLLCDECDYHDVDLEVHHISLEILEEILSKYGKVGMIGKPFGVLTVDSLPEYEFALPRQDIKNGEGHKGFTIHIDPELPVEVCMKRRDFTINALYYDIKHDEILDYHNGLKDIEDSMVRMVNPETFKDDPLRVYRAAGLMSRFNLDIDETTYKYCEDVVRHKGLDTLSNARIYEEYSKMLMGLTPSKGFHFLKDIGGLPNPFMALVRCHQRLDYHPEGSVWNHTMMVVDEGAMRKDVTSNPLAFMWSCLCHDLGKPIVTTPSGGAKGHPEAGVKVFDAFFQGVVLDKKMREYIRTMILWHMHLMWMSNNNIGDETYYEVLKGIDGKVPLYDLILISYCDKLGRGKNENGELEARNMKQIDAFYGYISDKIQRCGDQALKPCITGNDMIALNIPPKNRTQVLEQCYKLQMKGYSREDILDKVQELK